MSTLSSSALPGTPPEPAEPVADLAAELALVQAELTRADGKASTLLALTGLATTATVTVLTGRAHLPTPALALGWVATGLLAAAMLLLIRAIRPQLGGPYGVMAWAQVDPACVLDWIRGERMLEHDAGGYRLVALSRLARTKYRTVRRGVDLLAAAVIVLAAAGVTGALTSAVTR